MVVPNFQVITLFLSTNLSPKITCFYKQWTTNPFFPFFSFYLSFHHLLATSLRPFTLYSTQLNNTTFYITMHHLSILSNLLTSSYFFPFFSFQPMGEQYSFSFLGNFLASSALKPGVSSVTNLEIAKRLQQKTKEIGLFEGCY